MKDLIVGPLDEGGVDGRHRSETFGSQPGGKGEPVLFGDSHVETAVGISPGKGGEAGTIGHGCGDGHKARVPFGFLHHGAGEDRRREAGA